MSYVDQAGFDQVRLWLSSRCGITFPDHKSDLLRQRMGRVLRRFDFNDLNHLAGELTKPSAQTIQMAVMDAASINHTYFYREPEVLERFMEIAFPTFKDRDEFRIWSAAASTGDEAHTIAMMIAEEMGPSVLSKVNILGTDISGPVVDRAELGVYHKRHLSLTDPALVRKYLTPMGIDQFRVNQNVRDRCTFRRMNLKATPYPFSRPFQAVFCRNILYYFDKADQAATVRAIYDVTEPGGWLVTSVTESIRDLGTLWEPVASGLYRRTK